ncbi:hypothetical protein [Mesoplasma photuris]|uniref:hypothetical protein n=1 Tax=Mesoplasma photuris TaxID=217731 RepID=UPI0004E17425|nr:hypothetical protein [Mesoplasma photuris]
MKFLLSPYIEEYFEIGIKNKVNLKDINLFEVDKFVNAWSYHGRSIDRINEANPGDCVAFVSKGILYYVGEILEVLNDLPEVGKKLWDNESYSTTIIISENMINEQIHAKSFEEIYKPGTKPVVMGPRWVRDEKAQIFMNRFLK